MKLEPLALAMKHMVASSSPFMNLNGKGDEGAVWCNRLSWIRIHSRRPGVKSPLAQGNSLKGSKDPGETTPRKNLKFLEKPRSFAMGQKRLGSK